MRRRRVMQFALAMSMLVATTIQFAAERAFAGEILRVLVSPNPIILPKPPKLGGQFTIAVNGRGSCDHVVIYVKLPDDPPPSGAAWHAEKKNVVFNSNPAKTGTVGVGKGQMSLYDNYNRVVWAYPGPGSKDCKGRARTVMGVKKSP